MLKFDMDAIVVTGRKYVAVSCDPSDLFIYLFIFFFMDGKVS